jgi:cytidine deaminase
MKEYNLQKEVAKNIAINSMKKSITFKSKVGACLYSKEKYFSGFNIENKVHKGFHAEEVSIIEFLKSGIDKKDLIGIVIVYDFNINEEVVYPPCAICRQYLWEYTHPNLKVTVVKPDGSIIFEDKLKNLYPYPYPLYFEKE